MSISHIISLFLLHPNNFSAEIKNLKQRIMLQNNDNIDLSSDLAEAEEKMKKMQQDNSLRLKTLENIVSEKDQEIQSLKSQIDRIKNQTEERHCSKAIDIFEEEKGDNEDVREILEIVSALEEELSSVRNLVIVRKEEDDCNKKKISQLKTILENVVPYNDYQNLKKEKAELEAKVLKLTIQKMDLKRRNHIFGKLLTKEIKEEHEKSFKKTKYLF